MNNPYGNNGFSRINNQQRQPNPQQGFGQQQTMNQGYNNPSMGPNPNPYQQPMGMNPNMNPGFNNPYQQQLAQQQMMQQQLLQQQMLQQQMMQQFNNPMANMGRGVNYQKPGYGNPSMNPNMYQQPMGMYPGANPGFQRPVQQVMNQNFGQFGQQPNPYQQQPATGVKTMSSLVEDSGMQPVSTQNKTQNIQQVETNTNKCQEVYPADGHEFPPYYDPDKEELKQIVDEKWCTYTWKIIKKGGN